MQYEFKGWQELAWGAGIAAIVYIAGELVLFDISAIADWRMWTMALLSGSIRAAAGAFVALITRPK